MLPQTQRTRKKGCPLKRVERSFELRSGSGLGKAPRPELPIRVRPGERSPYARIFGSIPAEESDEEFAAAVAELS